MRALTSRVRYSAGRRVSTPRTTPSNERWRRRMHQGERRSPRSSRRATDKHSRHGSIGGATENTVNADQSGSHGQQGSINRGWPPHCANLSVRSCRSVHSQPDPVLTVCSVAGANPIRVDRVLRGLAPIRCVMTVCSAAGANPIFSAAGTDRGVTRVRCAAADWRPRPDRRGPVARRERLSRLDTAALRPVVVRQPLQEFLSHPARTGFRSAPPCREGNR